MSSFDTQVCIIGAGAAGLWAAAACAEKGVQTWVLEKTKRTGTKILSSGGSRCNLTTTLGPKETAKHFGAGHNFILPGLRNLSPQAARAHFEAIGVATKTEADFEKVFPVSDSALQVQKAMERHARAMGATFRVNTQVTGISAIPGGWRAEFKDGSVTCQKLLLCVGGQSYPATGTRGDGYPWLRSLGLKVVHPVPALVPLSSPASWVRELSGVAVDAVAKVGKQKRRRPVLFTHKGLSGPGPMDLSEPFARGQAKELQLDLLPEMSWEALREGLLLGGQRPGSPRLASLVKLSRRVLETVADLAELGESNPKLNQINKKQRQRLVETLKALRVPINGTLGFTKAEVTAGGLALNQVDRKTMQVHGHPGLYVFGELLDLTGPIGGFNFQAAWSTAQLAAESVAKGLGK